MAEEFGKDLGLMHEVVVMGRKAGFGREEWATIAHSESLMRKTLEFVRNLHISRFPASLPVAEKIERIAKLVKLIRPFMDEEHGCISCGKNLGKGKENGCYLLKGYAEISFELSEREMQLIEQGGCHQPLEMTFASLKEVLGAEYPRHDQSGWGIFELSKSPAATFLLKFVSTPATSLSNVVALQEAFDGLELGKIQVEILREQIQSKS
ncbi:MAG: hypothetical protein AAB364_01910 [Patescibacteria group bacterium]